MAEDYSRHCDSPREFEVAGIVLRVGKLCPRDIGDLQAWFKTRLPNPYLAARERLRGLPDEATDEERRAVWIPAVQEAQRDWPPSLADETGLTLLFTDEGKARLLYVASRRNDPKTTLERCRAIANVMTDEDYGQLLDFCLAWGDVGDVVQPADEDRSAGLPYPQVRAMLCEAYPGWTYETIDRMSFEQIRVALARGKPYEVTVGSEVDAERVAANWMRYYRGLP